MARPYRVVEERAYESVVVIVAENEEDARRGEGVVINSYETESWGERTLDVEALSVDHELVRDSGWSPDD